VKRGGALRPSKVTRPVKEGRIRWGRSMAWERGSAAPMA
jgi:hypothetical protein